MTCHISILSMSKFVVTVIFILFVYSNEEILIVLSDMVRILCFSSDFILLRVLICDSVPDLYILHSIREHSMSEKRWLIIISFHNFLTVLVYIYTDSAQNRRKDSFFSRVSQSFHGNGAICRNEHIISYKMNEFHTLSL